MTRQDALIDARATVALWKTYPHGQGVCNYVAKQLECGRAWDRITAAIVRRLLDERRAETDRDAA